MENRYDHIYYITANRDWTDIHENSYQLMRQDESICLGSIRDKVVVITINLHNLKE